MNKKIEVSKEDYNVIMNALIQAKGNQECTKSARETYEKVYNKLLNQ